MYVYKFKIIFFNCSSFTFSLFTAFELVYMDDFVDELLIEDRVCDVILPRLQVSV